MHIKTSNQEAFKIGFNDYSCNWGLHIAGLYETEAERDQIIFGFLKEGFLSDDLQLYCPAERSKENFIEHFSHFCPDCAQKLDSKDHIHINSAKELYYPDGIFSPLAMDQGLGEFYKSSQAEGKRNVRATAEMVWALEAIPGTEHLMAYESRLNYFVKNKPWVSICLYNLTKFSGDVIMGVLKTHPFTINKGVIMRNPYYQDPDVWLKENAPQFMKTNE